MKFLDFLEKVKNIIISPSFYMMLFAFLGTLFFVTGINILFGKPYAFMILGCFFLFFMTVIARGMRSG